MPNRSITWTAIDAARLSRFAARAEVRRANARTAAFAKLAATRAAAAHVARPLVVAGQYTAPPSWPPPAPPRRLARAQPVRRGPSA